MKICLIGKNLSNLLLAKVLANKNLNIDIIYNYEDKKRYISRTIGISKSNYNFLLKNDKSMKIHSWPIEKIKIFNDKKNLKESFEFNNKKKEIFFLIKYDEIYQHLNKSIKYNKNIKFTKLNNKKNENYFINNDKYNLIINSDVNSQVSKKFFQKKVEKNYYSIAYASIINHKKIKNNVAIQIFTKFGPLAFLPLSNTKTSIVFSVINKTKKNSKQIINLIKKFNLNYKIIKFEEFEKFNLKFSMLRNYYFKNILCFGDLLHKIHPLAGQGFNMTIRDTEILSNLIEEKIKLGLDLDNSILEDFEKKNKHLNYLFGYGVDLIYEFFKTDNKFNNIFSSSLFNLFKKQKFINKYATYFADKGI